MKILHLSSFYYPAVGGAQTYIQKISEGLVRRGHDVTVYTSNHLEWMAYPPKKMVAGFEKINGVKILRFPALSLPFFLTSHQYITPFDMRCRNLANICLFLRLFSKPVMPQALLKIGFNNDSFDLIHSISLPWSNSIIAYYAAKITKKPFIITPLPSTIADYECFSFLKIMREADAAIVNTQFEKDIFIRKGVKSSRIYVIGVGIDPGEFRQADGNIFRRKFGIGEKEPMLLFVGARTEGKGIFKIISALEKVYKEIADIKLVIIGPMTREYRKYMMKIPEEVKSHIIDLGVTENPEKAGAFKAADIFVMPSISDTFGIVYLEAWLCKKPVIGARFGPMPYIIRDRVDGVLVRPGNIDDLAEKIILLLKDRETREKMGLRGYKKTMSKYTWDKITKKVEDVYLQVLRSGLKA